MGCGGGVRSLLLELFRDNHTLLENMPPIYISTFFDLIKAEKETKLMEFLTQVCSSDDLPYVNNQKTVLELLQKNLDTILLLTRVELLFTLLLLKI